MMVVISGTLTDRIKPIEILGLGKGFERSFNAAKPEENSGDETYKSDIEQIANELAQAATASRGMKHSPIQDTLGKVPTFLVRVEDILPRTMYLVFACTAYVEKGQHLKGVAMVQDDACDYNPTILENFVKSL